MNRAERRLKKKETHPHNALTQDELVAMALQCQSAGQFDKAHEAYLAIVELQPDWAEAQSNLGAILQLQGKLDEAVLRYQQALALMPGSAAIHYNLGNVYKELGKYEEAIAHYEKALAIHPEDAGVHNNLGVTLKAMERLNDAASHYRQALNFKPDFAEAYNNLGNVLKEQGRGKEAREYYEQALALNGAYAEAQYNLAETITFHSGDKHFTALEKLAGNMAGMNDDKKIYVHFTMAKALDDTGNYDSAFAHWAQGNALKRKQIRYDEPRIRKTFRSITKTFDPELFTRFQGAGEASSAPVFIVGMPRCGSSLIEQILASHPDVHGAGELNILEKIINTVTPYPAAVTDFSTQDFSRLGRAYLERLPQPFGKTKVADKRLLNFMHIGLLRLILPDARIIHVRRNPADTCISCFTKLFASDLPFCYDLAELGRYYGYYEKLMVHWREVLPPGIILDIQYENLVQNPREQIVRLLEFCGLTWDERCMSFHETDRPVTTASALQVRKPMFDGSINRWERYKSHLKPLLNALKV